jgi:hypothetical protein
MFRIQMSQCNCHATTMKAAWNVEFLRFNDKNVSNTRGNGGWNFMKITSSVYFFQN